MMNILSQFCMTQLGFGPVGEIRMVGNGTSNASLYYRDKINDANRHTDIQKAYAATVTGRNDVVLVTPESNTWVGDAGVSTAALTWDKQNVHMLGMDPGALPGYGRARFSHAGTMVSMLEVAGSGNKFKNIRWMHGIGDGDVTCLTAAGAGNQFENCCFGGPLAVAQGADADYNGVICGGTQNYWKHCMFGTANSVLRTTASCVLEFTATCGGMNIFEDCIFRSAIGATTPYFINDLCSSATSDDFHGIFLNCQFINQSSAYTMTLGINKTANTHRHLYFDNRCTFVGVQDIVTSARVGEVWWGAAGVPCDETALLDRLRLGRAGNPAVT
jgi:hypothetical protein